MQGDGAFSVFELVNRLEDSLALIVCLDVLKKNIGGGRGRVLHGFKSMVKHINTYIYGTETSVLTCQYNNLVLPAAISEVLVKIEDNGSDCWKAWYCVCLF